MQRFASLALLVFDFFFGIGAVERRAPFKKFA